MKIMFYAILALIIIAAAPARAAIDPALAQKESDYKKAAATLTKEQQAALAALDKKNSELNAPNFDIIAKQAIFNACAKIKPDFVQQHGDALLTYKYNKLDEYAALRTNFFTEMAKIDFIDKNLLDGHLTMQANREAQLVSGAAGQLQNIKPGECVKLVSDFDLYSTIYFAEANGSVFHAAEVRDSATNKVTSCSLALAHNQPDGAQHSVALLVIPESPESGTFEFSAKTFASAEKTTPIESLWIDFGTLSTRFTARMTRPGAEMAIGSLPAASVVAAMQGMARMPTVISIKNAGKDKARVFRTQIPARDEMNKFAKCVGEAQPKLIAPLEKAGFAALTGKDPATEIVDPYYNASQMSPSRKNPGICMLNIGPYQEKPDVSMGAVLVIGVERMRNKAVAAINGFWVLGQKGQSRLTIDEARLITKDLSDGTDLNTDKMRPHLDAGQRYEIYFSSDENESIMRGMMKTGIRLEAKSRDLPQPVSHAFPPPRPETITAFNGCLARLKASMDAHLPGR